MKRKTTVIDPNGQPFKVPYSHKREGLILVDYKYKPDSKTTSRVFNVTHEASGYQIDGCVSTLKEAKAMQSYLLGWAKELGISWFWDKQTLIEFLSDKGFFCRSSTISGMGITSSYAFYLSGGAE